MLEYGLIYIQQHISKGLNNYLSDQEVITIALKKYNKIVKGLYSLPHYTVGIPPEKEIKNLCVVHPIHCDKEYSLKERLLYYINDNRYYTSLKNKYIVFSRNTMEKNKTAVANICKIFKLILILPDQNCKMPNCLYKMNKHFGDMLIINYFKKESIRIRESISYFIYNNIHNLFDYIIIS